MNDLGGHLLMETPRRSRVSRFRPAVFLLVPLAAVLFQVYVPLFVEYFGYLELPLLVTVYFALMGRKPVAGVFLGAIIGLVQDSLSHQPLGMFGIVKTLVGYFAASMSQRFDVDNPAIRLILGFFFFFFHQFFYWVLGRALLGQPIPFDPLQNFALGMLNSAVSLPVFYALDKLKDRGELR
ncbi:MAG: rod shape-determining protein MreD [Acidobacteria bacterium]|nr:rod shape-determining protein MreD [Acidobacteriota bacterium]